MPYVLRHLANICDNTCDLAEPISMDATNDNGIVTIHVADINGVEQWNRALGGMGSARTNRYTDRSPIHSVHVWDWHGWTIHVWAEDAPDVVTDNQNPGVGDLQRVVEGLEQL